MIIIDLFDPFISGNELTDLPLDDVNPDFIIITHGHYDHIGDTVELPKNRSISDCQPRNCHIFRLERIRYTPIIIWRILMNLISK